ncbi:MAG: glycoside hydrolase family 36 protein [Armatimonadota bacterium]
MPQFIDIKENEINVLLEIPEDMPVQLLHFSALSYRDENIGGGLDTRAGFRLVDLQATGANQAAHHGSKHVGTSPADKLRYLRHRDYCNNFGRKLEIEQACNGLRVVSHLQFYNGTSVVRSWTEAVNESSEPLGIEYISSFSLTGIAKECLRGWEEKCILYVPHNTWQGEVRWGNYTLSQLGLYPVFSNTIKRLSYAVTGTWPCDGYIPMGIFENTECGNMLFWQIEAGGSWQWEISEHVSHLYLKMSGPTENENHWWKDIGPGETFESVPVAVGSVAGNLDEAMGELTRYRRVIRRPHADNENLPVIFNDYMNCLLAEPTTEKEIPLIDVAAEVGCEYFCIDAGWYADGGWWDAVGEWLPSEVRFPGGIKEPLDYIRKRGMIPGLWLEIEVMGINCPMATKVPDDWFFLRHGKRVIDNGRYQLDFRNPEVRAYADSVVDRLVNEYGVGYIKMDYNINAGTGTEVNADSFGDGLLQHNRAYLAWLDDVFRRYPDLVIENCGSGGLRMTYAFISRHSIQSTSDQSDCRKYPAIAAACLSVVTPEQAAVWSYPLKDGDREQAIFNMVNAMLSRIHQSGHIAEISEDCREAVREGIAYYKSIREDIKAALPIWPHGFPVMEDGWITVGLRLENCIYLSVWRLNSSSPTWVIPIPDLRDHRVSVEVGYPLKSDCKFIWNKDAGTLTVTLPAVYNARVFKLEFLAS